MTKKKVPFLQYAWKLVQELQIGDIVVIAQKQVMVVSIKHEGIEWVIGYDGGTANSTSNQVYQEHDSVYAKRDAEESRKEIGK